MAVRCTAPLAVFCGSVVTHHAPQLQELEQQTREVLAGKPVTKNIFKHQVRCLAPLRSAAHGFVGAGAGMTQHLIYVWTSERAACGA
jgi:hypothetical protein